MGLTPWTSRLTVEDCCCLAIEPMVRDGVFRTKSGTPWLSTWRNSEGTELFRVGYTVTRTPQGMPALHLSYDVSGPYSLNGRRIEYLVEITTTPCYLGGERHWFLCPIVKQG